MGEGRGGGVCMGIETALFVVQNWHKQHVKEQEGKRTAHNRSQARK